MSDTEGAVSPLTVLPHTLRLAAMPTPKQMVAFYDPDEFEVFVKEWIPALDTQYALVERHGGSGDHGIDVAGYLSERKLEGPWHNYQCKRYTAPLAWSVAAQEMRKMFAAAAAGHFTVPTRYVFAAPRISRSLPRQFAKPTSCRAQFLAELDTATEKFITDLSPAEFTQMKAMVETADFSIFQCIDLDEMLALHSTTRNWADRFPHAELGRGPETLLPPEQHSEIETRYVQHLVDVYCERFPGQVHSLEQVSEVAEADAHLKRQRQAFYSAEALRVFARDSTRPGHFEKVMEDVYAIVVEVAELTYPDGWARHGAVTAAAGSVQLTPTILTPFIETIARKGICHHLANTDRLIWCRKGES